MGENVKVYLENIPDKSHVRISAIYAFSVDSGHGPSLFVQRKVRYIYELCRNLDVHRFRIVPVAEKGSLRVLISDSLFSSHEFLNTVDYARWKDLVMPPNLTTFSGMLTELLASNRSNLETHPLDGNDLISMLERQDHDFLDRIQAQMQRNAIEIQRLGRDRDDGRREIAATKRAMEEDSVAHRALLSHLNLHDNHELSSIKDDFARLNNQINHYSTELSQSLVDYSSDHLNVLDCSDPKRLEAFMEISHLWGFRDAIKLGRAVSASLFLDFAISSIICGIFHRFIFRPFYPNLPLHPAAANSEERLELSVPVISKIYRELRLRDPQMQAAKWRSDTFTMLTNLGPCYETKLATEFISTISQDSATVGNKTETAQRLRIDEHEVEVVELPQIEESRDQDSQLINVVRLNRHITAKLSNNKKKRLLSGLYLQATTDGGPSLVAQQNVRFLIQLGSTLGFRHFFVVPFSVEDPGFWTASGFLNSSNFRAMVDFDLWKSHLPPPDCTNFSNLVQILSKPQPSFKKRPLSDEQLANELKGLSERFLKDIQSHASEIEEQPKQRIDAGVQHTLPQDEAGHTPEIPTHQQESQAATSIQNSDQQLIAQHVSKIQALEQEKLEAERAAGALKRALDDDAKVHRTLLSNLNLNDNHEMSSIKHDFEILNDQISDLASGLVEKLFLRSGASVDELNTMNCHDPTGLARVLGTSQERPSLIQSRSGQPLVASLFVDLAINAILCQALHQHVFSPFYPLVRFAGESQEAQNLRHSVALFFDIYQSLRQRDSQIQCAKWRVDTFSTLTKLDPGYTRLADVISVDISSRIGGITTCLIGSTLLLDDDKRQLKSVVEKALNLNHKIKTEVLRLGDFHTMCFESGERYDGKVMSILDERGDEGTSFGILSTCGLGVCATKAVGGGKEPEKELVMKAKIVSENIFV
ncbi:hypothetical protein FRC09_011350 [Ceratobasidium sp. 395]|nr:hypothetical protein FRC09_011350 [Ceratobasidium sp. 395]